MSEKFASMEGGVPKLHGHKYTLRDMAGFIGQEDKIRIDTSFPIRKDELDRLLHVDGVDSLDEQGRYTFKIETASMFDRKKVIDDLKSMMESIMEEHDGPRKADEVHFTIAERVRMLEQRLDMVNMPQYPNIRLNPLPPTVIGSVHTSGSIHLNAGEGNAESTPSAMPTQPMPTPVSPVGSTGFRTGGFN